MTSTTIPPWLIQARDVSYQRAISDELSKREKERSGYRNAPPTNTNTITSPLHKLLPGKSAPSSQPEKSDHSKHYSVTIGRDPTNRWGNRYSNIEPYDRTRVVVGTSESACLGCGEEKGRYFNGSWVKELHGQKLWIATQAPLRDTAHAFLSVLSQPVGASSDTSLPQGSRVRTVVQLTLNYEKGRIKAYPYYPFTVGESTTIAPEPGFDARPFVVTLEEQTTIEEANCMCSKLSVVPQGENGTASASFTFTHMLYIAWPDHGIPQEEDQASLLKFVRLVDQVNKSSPAGVSDGSEPPIMVNCSAGVGRTGTFIAISSLLRFYNLLDKKSPTPFDPSRPTPTTPSLLGPLSQPDPVAQEIDALREQRPEMVQRSEQVAVIYQILEQAFMDK